MSIAEKEYTLNYRSASAKDLDAVFDLYMNEQSNPYLTYDQMDKEQFQRIYQELLESGTLHVVDLQNKVVGSYRLIPKKDRQSDTLYLGGFVVDHSLKGRGIGSKMLKHITELAVARGTKRIELTVDIENEAAINLYKKTGFIIEGYIRKSYKRSSTGIYYDEYLMGLIL